jgi:hypothetical protein
VEPGERPLRCAAGRARFHGPRGELYSQEVFDGRNILLHLERGLARRMPLGADVFSRWRPDLGDQLDHAVQPAVALGARPFDRRRRGGPLSEMLIGSMTEPGRTEATQWRYFAVVLTSRPSCWIGPIVHEQSTLRLAARSIAD